MTNVKENWQQLRNRYLLFCCTTLKKVFEKNVTWKSSFQFCPFGLIYSQLWTGRKSHFWEVTEVSKSNFFLFEFEDTERFQKRKLAIMIFGNIENRNGKDHFVCKMGCSSILFKPIFKLPSEPLLWSQKNRKCSFKLGVSLLMQEKEKSNWSIVMLSHWPTSLWLK